MSVLCDLQTRAGKGSALMPAQTKPVGFFSSCTGVAMRRCPTTSKRVCNSHSRTETTAIGLAAKRRNCSACGAQHDGEDWLAA
jgi:hypothetical protein